MDASNRAGTRKAANQPVAIARNDVAMPSQITDATSANAAAAHRREKRRSCARYSRVKLAGSFPNSATVHANEGIVALRWVFRESTLLR